MRIKSQKRETTYSRIYTLVSMIPFAKVATYGQIARFEGNSGARQVGYALSALGKNEALCQLALAKNKENKQFYPVAKLPWHRVVNAQGRISIRADENNRQYIKLIEEGIVFKKGKLELDHYQWDGPDGAMIEYHGFYVS